MKLKKIIWIYLLLTNCIRIINYDVDAVPKQLVVNSIVEAKQLIEVNVSALASIFDSTYQLINDATVTISSEGFVDTLTSQGNGNYLSHFVAEEGGIYSLLVSRDSYPTVFARDTVPVLSKIIKANKTKTDELDEYGDAIYEYSVTFECDTAHPQNYELMFIEQSKLRDDDLFQVNFNNFDVEADPIIQHFSNDNIFMTYFFSSASIQDSNYTLNMKMQAGWSVGGQSKKPLVSTGKKSITAVVLRTVSQAYVDYRVSWEKHEMLKNDSSKVDDLILIPLIGQQQEMYSNIENGKGVFVCYAQSYFILD